MQFRSNSIPAIITLSIAAVAIYWGIFLYAPAPNCIIGAGDDLGCARGFQTREGDRNGSFRWSDEQVSINLAGAGWGTPQLLALRFAAPRPANLPKPTTLIQTDRLRLILKAPPEQRRYLILIPAPLLGSDARHIQIESEIFSPAKDERALGLAIYSATLLHLPTQHWPGFLPILALAAIAISIWNLAGRRWPAYLGSIITLLSIALLSILLPMRVLPFLPGMTLIALMTAWGLPLLGQIELPRLIWLCALVNLAIDAGIIADRIHGIWTIIALAAQALVTTLAAYQSIKQSSRAGILAIALLIRLGGFAIRIINGTAAVDPDTELFYNYGRATIELGVPIAEYPSGALAVWALLALPASRELFALLLPLLNVVADLAIVGGILFIGKHAESKYSNTLAIAYAITPLLLPFWHAKYDPLPAALTIVGLALWAAQKPGQAGAALGLGGAIKWAPWLALPILGWATLRPGPHWSGRVWRLILGSSIAMTLVSLPFALHDWHTFLLPYTIQGARPIIGESIWFLPAVLLQPTLLQSIVSPWSGTSSNQISPFLTMLVQMLALFALGLGVVLRPANTNRAVALAALAPACFLLLNRVFSPQYVLPISACLLAAAATLPQIQYPRRIIGLVAAITLMQAANLLVWPLTNSNWIMPSAILFTLGVGSLGYLAYQAIKG